MDKAVVDLFEQALDPGKNWKANDKKYAGSTVLNRCQTFEIKFSIMLDQNPGLAPEGLKIREHLDRKQQLQGAYRNHGEQVLKTGEVALAMLAQILNDNGLKLVEIFGYNKTEYDEHRTERSKLVVVLKYSRKPELPEVPLNAGAKKLLDGTWGDCYVWDNTLVSTAKIGDPDRSVTVNCRRPLNRPATGDVVIVDGVFKRSKRQKGN